MNDLLYWHQTQQHFTKPDKDEVERSHLLLNGGSLYIPREKEREFLKRYAEELKKNTKLYYVEVRPKIFRYMIDIDISDDHYWSDEEITEITLFVNDIVSEFYERPIVICNKAGLKYKDTKIHTGIHLIYPKIFITSENAILIRQCILQKLNEHNEHKFKKPEDKSWEDIFDEVIYKKNGYRMIGSDKILDKKTGTSENRVYWPFKVFIRNSEGNKEIPEYLSRLINNYDQLMFETSIRYVPENYQIIDNMGMIPNIPTWIKDDIKIPNINRRKYNKISGHVMNKEKELIEYFIKKNIKEYEHEQDLIKEVLQTPSGNLLIKSGSKFCLNIGRSHKSCGIYFMIYNGFLVQKCLCPCDNLKDRRCGLCKNFISQEYKLPIEYYTILFPNGNVPEFIKNIKISEHHQDNEEESLIIAHENSENNEDKNKNDEHENKKNKNKELLKKIEKIQKNQKKTFIKHKPGEYVVGMANTGKYVIDKEKQICGTRMGTRLGIDLKKKKTKDTKDKDTKDTKNTNRKDTKTISNTSNTSNTSNKQ